MLRTYRGHRILIKLLRFQEGWMANTFSHQILLKVLDMMLNAIQKYYMKKNPNFFTTEGRYWSMVEFGMVFVFDMYCCF